MSTRRAHPRISFYKTVNDFLRVAIDNPLSPFRGTGDQIVICIATQPKGFLICTVAVAQWVKHWSSKHRVVQAEGSRQRGDDYQTFFSNDFHFSLGLMDFSAITMLCNRPNNCCQQNLKCFDEPSFS